MTTDFTHIPIDAETFLDKLACGFGRVILFLREHDARPYREAILDSCLHHRAFDRQVESYRTEYLLDIMEATGEPEFYTARIKETLLSDSDEYAFAQLYELALAFAQQGDAEARRLMYDRFARQAVSQDTTGAEEIVALDGLDGYLFIAEQWRRHPLPEEDHWEEAWLWERLEERLGPEEAKQALARASQSDPGLADYLAAVEQKRTRWHDWQKNRPRVPIPTYDEITAHVADPTQTTRWHKWRSWARRLDVATLTRLAHDLLAETDRVPLLKRLHMFRELPFPLPPDRLLDLARMRDEDIAEAAQWALGNLTDPRIRALALELEDDEAALSVLHLLRNNFADGDYARVERIVRREWDGDDFHRVAMLTRRLIEAHPLPEATTTLLVLYERGRCALCRGRVVELLLSLGPLPPWIVREGRYDADTETRKITRPLA